MKRQLAKKGYTLEVQSWENDGDNSWGRASTFETEGEALLMMKMCKELFASENDSRDGIGNMMEDDNAMAKGNIISYLGDNAELLEYLKLDPISKYREDIVKEFEIEEENEENWAEYVYDYVEDHPKISEKWHDAVMEINGDLMGYSEYYYSRVFESAKVLFSAEDVFLELTEIASTKR